MKDEESLEVGATKVLFCVCVLYILDFSVLTLRNYDQVTELATVKRPQERAFALQQWQESGGVMIMGYEMYRNLTQGRNIKSKKLKETFQRTLVDPGAVLFTTIGQFFPHSLGAVVVGHYQWAVLNRIEETLIWRTLLLYNWGKGGKTAFFNF